MASSPPPSPETVSANADDRIDVLHFDRPQTPLATMPALLPTPDATPRQLVSGKRELSLSLVPAINPELADSPTLIRTSPSLPRNQREVIATEVQMGVRFITAEAQEAPTLPPRPLGADGIDEPRTSNQDTWRISDYRPEFLLPARPTVQTTVDHATLARAPFDGTPLQELPRSQLSKSAEAHCPLKHTERRAGSYPDGKSGSSGAGDFAIDILPSPTSAYHRIPDDYRPAGQNRRQSRSGSSRRNKDVGAGGGRDTFREVDLESGRSRHEWDTPPVIERAFHAASVSIFQGLAVPMGLYRGFRDNYYPPPERPDIIKAYPVRRRLPVRIFFPSHHDLTSPALLPTLFTIHGGGFTVGYASDDDKWNRTFADTYTIIIISLNYSKAPWACFPAPLHDVEALYHAVLNDESLPIDRMRTALSGFDAGANLALALSQLPSVQTGREPSPLIPICGILDFTTSASEKSKTRPYKRSLRGPRGWGPGLDLMAKTLPSSAWSYIPYGHDTSDPLLSPFYAKRSDLPPHVFVIGAELDCLAHESWRAACSWAGGQKSVVLPGGDVVVGRKGVSRWRGCLDDAAGLDADKFGWVVYHGRETNEEEEEDKIVGSTRWLLVPDVVHGFDSAPWRNKYLWGDEEARMDAEMKTIAYQREMAEWLWGTVWK
ncbi:Alpha/Beta hydrolase protein [Rhypophila decipiens]|uniref:Alpha/Beta hydrolase protein n=1 Tax=Rhypophila decipiens TaxID=261697 RepID=A0AAN6XX23_9PEZI|nr:Alpha/Beta hydrolase protein [Rhypophila decipiens]